MLRIPPRRGPADRLGQERRHLAAAHALRFVFTIALAVIAVGAITSCTSSVDSLRAGECIDQPDQGSTVTQVQRRPCTTAHDAEVFAVLTHPAGPDEPYPVASAFTDFVLDTCIPLWEAYTGRSWGTDTELNINFLSPTMASWSEGDRGLSCYTARYGGGKLIDSVKGIGAAPLPVATP